MKTYRIEYQKTLYGDSDKLNPNITKVYSQIIECDSFIIHRDKITINEKNIHILINNQILKSDGTNYNLEDIGQIYEGPKEKITFHLDNHYSPIKEVYIFADPYYKLFEIYNEREINIDEHKCNNSRCSHNNTEQIILPKVEYNTYSKY